MLPFWCRQDSLPCLCLCRGVSIQNSSLLGVVLKEHSIDFEAIPSSRIKTRSFMRVFLSFFLLLYIFLAPLRSVSVPKVVLLKIVPLDPSCHNFLNHTSQIE